MDDGPILKLIEMKEAEAANLIREATGFGAQLMESERQAIEARAMLNDRNARKERVMDEIALLRQAIDGEPIESPGNASDAGDQFVIDILGMPGALPARVDVRQLDLSDGEPKVRQHTIEVRRLVVLLIAKRGPMSSSDIIEGLSAMNFIVSDENAVANLSAILSRTTFFSSQARKWHLDYAKLNAARKSTI